MNINLTIRSLADKAIICLSTRFRLASNLYLGLTKTIILFLFAGIVFCLPAIGQTISIKGTPQAASNIAPSLRNRVLYLFEIDVAGSPATFTGFSGLTTAGSYQATDINPGIGGNRGFRMLYMTNSAFISGVSNLENAGSGSVNTWPTAGTNAGQTIIGTFTPSQTLAVGKHWALITVDVAVTATNGRTIGLAAFTNTIFQFSGMPIITGGPFLASGLQTIANATLSLSAAAPIAANVEIGINHLQLYRLDISASGATTQIGDGNAMASISFDIAGTVLGTGTTNINNLRAIYSTDAVLDATDQQLGSSKSVVGSTVTFDGGNGLPIIIPQGQTRYIFLTTHTQPTATIGTTISVSAVGANAPAGTSFAVGNTPADMPAGGVQTIGSNVANITLTGIRVPATTPLYQGSKNNYLGRIEVNVTGGTTVLSRLGFNMAGNNIGGGFFHSDYTAFKLWVSTSPTFNVASSTFLKSWTNGIYANDPQIYNFSGIFSLASNIKYYGAFRTGTVNYFYLTVDVAPNAAVGTQFGMTFNATNSNTTNTIMAGNRTVIPTPPNPLPVVVVYPQINITSTMSTSLNLPHGALNQVLYNSKINVTNQNTILQSVTLNVNTTNFNDIVGGYKLYYSTSAFFDIGTAVQIGITIPATTNSQTLSFVASPSVASNIGNDLYLYLVANTNAAAVLGNQVVVALPTENDFVFSAGIEKLSLNAVTHTISGWPNVAVATPVVSTENVGVGTKNIIIYRANLSATVANAQFTGLKLVTATTGLNNGDISNYRLYYSADANFDPLDVQVGASVTGAGNNQDLIFNANAPILIANGTTGFFFLLADISSIANIGSIIRVNALQLADVFLQLGTVSGTGTVGAPKTIVAPPEVAISSATPSNITAPAGTSNVVLYRAQLNISPNAYVNLLAARFVSKSGFAITDISSGYRLYLSNDGTFDIATDQLIAITASSNNPGTIFFFSPSAYTLPAGATRFLFLVTDISLYALMGNTVQVDPLLADNLFFESSTNTSTTNNGNIVQIGARAVFNYPFPTPTPILVTTNSSCPDQTVASKILNITLPPYSADPTGVADATTAFRLAVSQTNSFVYIPNGTYRLSDSIIWNPNSANGRGGAGIILWGESREGVTIKLDANAAGFGNPAVPKTFIHTGEDDPQRFNNSLHNLTIEIGSGNPGVRAVRHYCNNYGGMYNVTVRAVDGNGKIGIDKAYSRANGPSLLKDILVDGFDVGIETDYSVESETMEHITLRNQKVVGFLNHSQIVSLRDLRVENCGGTALVNETGHITLLDSKLSGTGAAAIRNDATGKMLLRNITCTGYSSGVADPQRPVSGLYVDEWFSDSPVGRNGIKGGRTLRLPIKETPIVPWDAPSSWVHVDDFGTTAGGICSSIVPCKPCDDDGPAIQAAIDATLPGGSREGATTLFLSTGYRLHSTVRIRGSIRRIIGLGNGTGGPSSGTIPPDGMPSPTSFIIEAGTYPEIVLAGLTGGGSTSCHGCLGITHIENNSGRTLILQNSVSGSFVFNGGEVFIESLSGGRDALFTFNNCNVWARQINPERDAAKVVVNGGTFWCLGFKTEGAGQIIVAKNNAKVELFGGFIYSLSDSRFSPMFDIEDAEVSLNFFEYTGFWGRPYLDIVKDRQQDNLVTLVRGANSLARPAPQPVQIPTYPANWSQRNDGTNISNNDNVVGTNLVLYTNTNKEAIAGNDTTVCFGSPIVSLAAVPIVTYNNDYTTKWSIISGGSGTFNNENIANSFFYPAINTIATYQLKWAVTTKNIEISSDTLTVRVVQSNAIDISDAQNNVFINNWQTIINSSACGLIARLVPSGVSPVLGMVAASVYIRPNTLATPANRPYVRRYYQITPAANPSGSTGTVTLYFTQADFTSFNSFLAYGPKLPINATDAVGKSSLRVTKYAGTSLTGNYGTYAGAATVIDPDDNNIVWNNTDERWEVTFNVIGFSGFFISNQDVSPLPLNLLSFSGKLIDKTVSLNWTTLQEVNTDYFDVERSKDFSTFIAVGQLKAKGSFAGHKYNFLDPMISWQPHYYRLKMADKDGKMTYSKTIVVKPIEGLTIDALPNPFKDRLILEVYTNQAEKAEIVITDLSGRILIRQIEFLQSGFNRVEVKKVAMLADGSYRLTAYGQSSTKTISVIKQGEK